jgi:NAD(P)-dependent dehydrogenase (short-subunit alcohol dehydrogenase family)
MARQRRQSAPRHVVITGAGTGIGRAIALRMAGERSRLSLLARDVARLKETAKLARDEGAASVFVHACDIKKPAQVGKSFAAAAREHGPIHVLVANSGIGGPNAPGKRDRFEDLVATNLSGTYSCLRAAQALLAPGPELRHLVVMSSILGRIGVAGYTGYCATKTGLIGLVRALALELASENVQVNAVCPGWVDTEMAWQGIDGMARAMGVPREQALAVAMQDVPMGRMGQPEDVAGLVAWLVSNDARGVTGQGLDINGGAY